MEFILTKASDPDFRKTIQLNSIEELVNFVRKINCELVIGTNEGITVLMIYDYYVE